MLMLRLRHYAEARILPPRRHGDAARYAAAPPPPPMPPRHLLFSFFSPPAAAFAVISIFFDACFDCRYFHIFRLPLLCR